MRTTSQSAVTPLAPGFHQRGNLPGSVWGARRQTSRESALAQPRPSAGRRGDGTIRVLVDTPSGEFVAVWAELTTTLAAWRSLVQKAIGMETSVQRWMWDGLEETVETLGDLGVRDGDSLVLLVRLRGGMQSVLTGRIRTQANTAPPDHLPLRAIEKGEDTRQLACPHRGQNAS